MKKTPYERRISDWSSDVCSSDLWRAALHFADDRKLLPRAYLWGLADTVRTGVEGRGIGMHFVWGKVHYGHPPWFSWPAILAAKLPLGLLVLALAGVPL